MDWPIPAMSGVFRPPGARYAEIRSAHGGASEPAAQGPLLKESARRQNVELALSGNQDSRGPHY